jgi:hypothetical protein
MALSVTVSTDRDGNPRIVDTKVYMGAYELAYRLFLSLTIRGGA